MNDQAPYTPQAAAAALDVSPATLRRWSQRFDGYLSPAQGQGKQRHYTEADLALLRRVQALMQQGLTYDQVDRQLSGPTEAAPPPVNDQEKGLTVAGAEPPVVAFLNNTLLALSESQKSILNSQAANRELMGVLIQDNFNLKEENNRLRERILDVERSIAQTRQENEWQRESLRQEVDAKLMAVQQTAAQAVATAQTIQAPELKAVKSKPGCLGALFGGGDVQIISIPGRRQRDQRADGRKPEPSAPSYPALPPEPPQAAHPKPFLPPE
jgi:DNA-binding transcriptional MerR regulator